LVPEYRLPIETSRICAASAALIRLVLDPPLADLRT